MMKVDGACHCGEIRFEAEVDPQSCYICHCTDCQHFSGGPFRTVVFAPGDKLTLLSGTPRTYVKTAESGNRRIQAFCGTCGAPVAYAADRYPDEIHFYAALLDDAADFAPQGHVHWDERLPWVHLADDLPKKEG